MDNNMRLLTLLFVAFTFSTTAQTAINFNIDDVDGKTIASGKLGLAKLSYE
jgi:hypothetical protein